MRARLVALLLASACGSTPAGQPAEDGGVVDVGATDAMQQPDAVGQVDARPDAGPDAMPQPDAPDDPDDVVAPFVVVTGEAHTCALGSTGTLRCWGANHMGQLGIATSTTCSGFACQKLPATVLEGVASIAVGGSSTCAVMTDHTVKCFGDDRNRKLGFGGPDNCSMGQCAKTPTLVPGLTANAMAVGHSFACALGTTGAVSCAGDNQVGQIGNGTTTMAPAFTAVTGLARPAISLAAGAHHTCALLDDHTVACWGSNTAGQLGTPTNGGCSGGADCSTAPLAITGLTNVVALTAGSQHTCALRGDRTLWCWGSNQTGQAGVQGDTCLGVGCSKTPRQVAIGPAFQVATGWDHTCARLVDGTVKCWGDNFAGQIGVASTSTCGRPFGSCVTTPTVIPGVTDGAHVALGGGYSCVLQTSGSALCWGSNALGQFGDGSNSSTTAPAPVTW